MQDALYAMAYGDKIKTRLNGEKMENKFCEIFVFFVEKTHD